MEKSKIERIIQIVRENMVVGSGGFTGSSNPKGPVAGFDPVISFPVRRRKNYSKGGHGSRKNWLDYLRNYNARRNQSSGT